MTSESCALTEPPGDIIQEFLSAIDEGREPECCAQDNVESLKMVFAAIRSAEEDREVRLDEFDGR